MHAFIAITSALFDVLLAPFGHRFAAFDLVLWPALAGVVALWVYKHVSNQAGIKRAKNGIQVHLLEIVLYRDDLIGVVVSTARAMAQNALYVGFNILPMIVMFVPMTAVLVQIIANYAYGPLDADARPLLDVHLVSGSTVKSSDVQLKLPPGLNVDAGPVRTPDGQAAWRLRADAPGSYVVTLTAGGEVQEKGLVFGGEPGKMPVTRTQSWEAVLYPGEPSLPSGSNFESITTHYPDRALDLFPDGESGLLAWFFVFSLAAGFALKGQFGVTL